MEFREELKGLLPQEAKSVSMKDWRVRHLGGVWEEIDLGKDKNIKEFGWDDQYDKIIENALFLTVEKMEYNRKLYDPKGFYVSIIQAMRILVVWMDRTTFRGSYYGREWVEALYRWVPHIKSRSRQLKEIDESWRDCHNNVLQIMENKYGYLSSYDGVRYGEKYNSNDKIPPKAFRDRENKDKELKEIEELVQELLTSFNRLRKEYK
jgi:hypothetical protein